MSDVAMMDAEQHFYEPDDCFTRHLEAKYRNRALHVTTNTVGERCWVFGERPMSKAHYARDTVLPPGAYGERIPGAGFPAEIPADQPLFSDRAQRLKLMSDQSVDAALMLPSMTIHVEHDMRVDVDAA